MKRITYFLHRDKFLLSEIRGRDDGMVEINFGDKFSGKLIIGKEACKIEDGKTVIDITALNDGTQELFVIRNKKGLAAESFEKTGNTIKSLPLPEIYIRELISELSGVKKKIEGLDELCGRISDKIEHTTIF